MNEYSIQIEVRKSGIFSSKVIKGTEVVKADSANQALEIFRDKWKSELSHARYAGSPISIINITKI